MEIGHLFWRQLGSQVIVASAIDVVRGVPGASSDLCDAAILGLLRDGYIDDAEQTVFREIRRLPAAHTLVLERGAAPRLRRHWEYPVPSPLRYRRESDYVDHFREVLDAAVHDRLRGGSASILLSGGLDSSTIAASARRVAPGAALRGITLDYPTFAPTDDERLASDVARRLQLSHLTLDLESYVALEHLEHDAALPPQPFDESDLGLWRVTTQAAAAFAPVTFFGEDGDTLLRAPTLRRQLRTRGLASTVVAWMRYMLRTRRRPWVGLEWRRRLADWRPPPEASASWLRADALRRAAVAPRARPQHERRPNAVHGLSSPQWDAVYATLAPPTTLSSVLFTLPLVDPRVLAFVFAIPPVPFCQDKYLFREAAKGVLPDEVVSRPKVTLGGFIEARVAQWRASGGAQVPLSPRVAPYVDVDAVRRVYESGDPYRVVDAWRVVQLDRWLAREETRWR